MWWTDDFHSQGVSLRCPLHFIQVPCDVATVQKLSYVCSLCRIEFWRTQAWDISLSSAFCSRDRLSHAATAFIQIFVCQDRMGSTVGSSEGELAFLSMLILSLWSFITVESQLWTSWPIFYIPDAQEIFVGCPARRRFLRIDWKFFVHKEEKYIVFLLYKVWNEENNRFHNSTTHYGFRHKWSSSLAIPFLQYSYRFLTSKKHCYLRHVVTSLQDTALFWFFSFCQLFPLPWRLTDLLSFFLQCFREPISAGSVQECNPLCLCILSDMYSFSLYSWTHKLPDNSCSKTASQNMPGPVSIVFLHARKREGFLQNLRVTDNMVDIILTLKTVTIVVPHTFIPVIDGANIKKLSCNLRRISLWAVTVIPASILQWQIVQKPLESLIFLSAHACWLWWAWINMDVPFLLTCQLTTEIRLNVAKKRCTRCIFLRSFPFSFDCNFILPLAPFS